jgi:hypothetical protein
LLFTTQLGAFIWLQSTFPGIETLIIYLGNILKYPTTSRYFTINKSNRIYRQAFDGFESEIEAFFAFLGSCPNLHTCAFVFWNFNGWQDPHQFYLTGFQNTFLPSKASPTQNSEASGDGLESLLTLPMDFCWETVSEAHRILSDYRKLPNIERWYQLETKVEQKKSDQWSAWLQHSRAFQKSKHPWNILYLLLQLCSKTVQMRQEPTAHCTFFSSERPFTPGAQRHVTAAQRNVMQCFWFFFCCSPSTVVRW